MIQKKTRVALAVAAIVSPAIWSGQVLAQETKEGNNLQRNSNNAPINNAPIEEILVLSQQTSYANNVVPEEMKQFQSPASSVMGLIGSAPGVLINEGDAFGADDWSTTVSMRGFQLSLDEQQIGMTIDGIPNGGSNYGGGSKANRFIDTENVGDIIVSQGTADIASRSHEALGGTLDFRTQSPLEQSRLRTSFTQGDYDANKYFVRYDTGNILNDTTRAYFSFSDSAVKSWIDESGENLRTHFAAKFESDLSWANLTGYFSYDDTEEDNYQRVSLDEFAQNPDWDRLTGEWTGIPLIDQLYRKGWSTLRENTLGYVRFDFGGEGQLTGQVTPYFHYNEGRGDWLPPYIANVSDNGLGVHSELTSGNTVYGGSNVGTFTYVSRNGLPLARASDCSSLTFPYGGTANDPQSQLDRDPACFPNDAVPVGSYRHTHYEKSRFGLTGDIQYVMEFEHLSNTLRGGFWWEDQTREEYRDWHKVIDSRTGFYFDATPYWVQYDREYPQTTTMLYVEDAIELANLKVRLGLKQWYVDVEREDNFLGAAGAAKVSSDSDVLVNFGVQYAVNDSMEVFAGYAENYAAIKDVVLEAADIQSDPQALDNVEPETAENIDLGIRFNYRNFLGTVTYYQINFENRITQLDDDIIAGIDFLEEDSAGFINAGGIESKGFELSGTWNATDELSIFATYTNNNSEYKDSLEFENGNTVFGSVEDLMMLGITWTQGKYNAGVTNKFVGDRWLDPSNTQRVDGYQLVDAYVSVGQALNNDIFKGYEVSFTVNNLLDEDYLGGIAGGSGAWIGAGRTASVNFKLDF